MKSYAAVAVHLVGTLGHSQHARTHKDQEKSKLLHSKSLAKCNSIPLSTENHFASAQLLPGWH